MSHRVLIIGAGGVGRVVTHKCAQASDVFSRITLASRREEKCKAIAKDIDYPIETAQVDADNVAETVALLKRIKPDLVRAFESPVTSIAFSQRGRWLATGAEGLRIWTWED